jgi:tetratricopeptide (TPR) repeat protein
LFSKDRTAHSRGQAVALLVGLVCLGAYALTLPQSCWVGDSGELTANAAILGISHPPGYPLYTLAGRVLLMLAPVKPAVAMNVFSAVASACAATLVALLVLLLGGGRTAAFAAGLLYGLARSTWRYSTVTEVYALHVMLAVLTFLLATRSRRAGSARLAVAACWVAGLGLAHHTSTLLLLPALVAVLARPLKSARNWWKLAVICLAALALGLTAYLYLPIRSRLDPPNDWGNPETPRAVWEHVTGKLYAGQMGVLARTSVTRNLKTLVGLVLNQWPPPLLLLPTIGVVLSVRRHGRRLLLLAAAALPLLAFGLTYRIPDIEPQFLPLTVLAVVASVPTLRLLERQQWTRAVVIASALLVAPWSFVVVRGAACSFPENFAKAAIGTLPGGSILLCRGQLTPLLAYAQQAEKLRPDVRLIDQLGNLFDDPYHYRTAAVPPVQRRLAVERTLMQRHGRLFYLLLPEAAFETAPCGLFFRALPLGDTSPPCTLRASKPLTDPPERCLREPAARELAVQYHLSQARWALVHDRAAAAERHLSACTSLSEGSPQALTALADFHRDRGSADRATTLYRTALRLDRSYLPAVRGLARVAPAEARFALEGAARAHTNDPGQLVTLAEAWLDVGRPAEAERLAMKALRVKPRDCGAALVLGNSRVDQGKLTDAETAYRAVVSLCPDLADAWANLCLVYGSTDRLELAADAGQRALTLAPSNLAALNNLATTYARMGRLEDAGPLWRRSLEIDPSQDRIRGYLESAPTR